MTQDANLSHVCSRFITGHTRNDEQEQTFILVKIKNERQSSFHDPFTVK